MKVREFGPGDVPFEEWRALPFEVYRDDDRWIAPFADDDARVVSADNSILGHAELRFFIAAGGRARIAACLDHNLRHRGAPAGTLGYFEMTDPAAGRAVVEAGRAWLEASGAEHVLAPVNFSIWRGYRFRTAGFEHKPFYGEPYNPPEYPKLFEELGFTPARRFKTLDVPLGDALFASTLPRDGRLMKKIEERGYTFPDLQLDRLESELRKVHRVILAAFQDFVGFSPLPEEEFIELFSGLRHFVEPGMCMLPKNPEGETIGLLFAMPDLARSIRAMRGETDWRARLRYLLRRRRSRRTICLFAGLLPEARYRGVSAAGAGRLLQNAAAAGYKTLTHGLVAEETLRFMSRWRMAGESDLARNVIDYALYEREA